MSLSQIGSMQSISRQGMFAAACLMVMAFANESHAGKGGKPDKVGDSGTAVTYQVNTIALPAGGVTFLKNYRFELNEWGQVLGMYLDRQGTRRHYVYDPTMDTDQAVVLEDEFKESWELNDDMDFIGYIGGFQVLKHQDRTETITISNVVDRSTNAIAWDTPELWVEFFDLGERWVFDEEKPANNYPPIAGYVVIGPDNGSSPVPQGFILTPIVQ